MAKKETSGNQAETAMGTFGPNEEQSAAGAYPADLGPSRDAKDYVLVTTYTDDGLRVEQQVLKSDLENSEEYKNLSLDSENVVEAHPAANRPTSDLTEEEAKAEGRV